MILPPVAGRLACDHDRYPLTCENIREATRNYANHIASLAMSERGRYHDVELGELRAKWPDWQIWTVPTWDGQRNGIVWCAMHGDTRLKAYEPEHLAEYLADQSWPDV